jgi:hypothetical protein
MRGSEQVERARVRVTIAVHHVLKQHLGLSGLHHEAAHRAVQLVELGAKLTTVLVPRPYDRPEHVLEGPALASLCGVPHDRSADHAGERARDLAAERVELSRVPPR